MTDNYEALLESYKFPNGARLANRITMSPMVVLGSTAEGKITEEDLHYFDKRSKVAGMLITGAASVSQAGRGAEKQISVTTDEMIPGLKKLAETMKKDGNKAILQLHHAGREAFAAYQSYGQAVAPSAIDFPFLPYKPKELSQEEIITIIREFGQATRRAIEAGFDGVEIHGANHYLIQQFFSSYSNRREDEWGGTLEKRMNFPLAIVKEVKQVVENSDIEDFIIGYRISPEEIHGDNIGYRLGDAQQLIDRMVDFKIDYIHVSLFTKYDAKAVGTDIPIGQAIQKTVGDRAAVMIIAGIFSADDALDALSYGDLVAIGRSALIDP